MCTMVKNHKSIEVVKGLRKKGLSYRQIAKLLDKQLKTVWRWSKYIDNETIPKRNN